MNILEKYIKGELSENEIEKVNKMLVTSQVENSKRKEWEKKLKDEYGVVRDPKSKNLLTKPVIVMLILVIAFIAYFLISLYNSPSLSDQVFVQLVDEEISQLEYHE